MSGYREQAGKVWIAGAGPGDRELLTVKTARLIKEADVIVYDALISAEILTQIPEQKELIHVGKRSGNHTVPQEEISRILVQEAKKGKKDSAVKRAEDPLRVLVRGRRRSGTACKKNRFHSRWYLELLRVQQFPPMREFR